MKSTLFAAALVLLLAVSRASDVADDEYADGERAHLVVHKAVVAPLEPGLHFPIVVQGRNLTVEITLYNSGSLTAKDVVLSDVLPSNAQLLSGSLSATFPAIASGSTVKHTYTLIFTAGGSMDITFLPSGTVTYKGDSEGTEQTGQTSRCGLFLLSPVQQIQRWALKLGVFASLGICKTPAHWRNMGIFVGIIASLLGVNYGVKQFGTTRTNTRRRRALQELEKEAGKDQ